MSKRIVIALGGNALGNTPYEQLALVTETAKPIVDLIAQGNEVIIAHGNGPQVGMIQNAFAAYHKQQAKSDIMPLSMCVAMSQGYIGYHLQQAIQQELPKHNNPYYEDEQAFTEAAAEHSAQMEAFFGTPGKANTAMPGRKRK